ncbi:TonB family protein [Escherichia coli]|nr:TonB family protein [Escherichia coli]
MADNASDQGECWPSYPEYAAANYIKGLVEVKFDIGADGTVTRIVFLRSEPHNLFRDEVVKAMAKWRFEKNSPRQGVKRQFIFTPSRP